MIRTIHSLVVVLSLLASSTSGGGGGDGRCPRIPSMTAEQACEAVCGTRRMHMLCLRTLLRRDDRQRNGGAADVTYYAGVAARSALDSYAATAAAKRAMLYGGAVPNDEKVAYDGCMRGYDIARRCMSRVAVDLTTNGKAADLTKDYLGSLSGMDACRKSLLSYPASPLYGMNLADRNKTLLAALLCSLVPRPPEELRGVHG